MKTVRNHSRGISRLEILVVIAFVALLVSFLIPAGSHRGGRERARRISCTANLKQVGMALLRYENDHQNRFPWMVPSEVNPTNTSGSLEHVQSPEVLRHFAVMSNELITPKLLFCPADGNRVRQSSFAQLSNSNLSYFAGLDADESKPQRILTGDRNITGGALSNGFLRLLKPTDEAGWSPGLHKRAGNIGLADGSVQQVTELALRRQLQASELPLIRLAIP
jgi:hypothetical protein